MTETRKAYLQLHFCVFLWGFTAILGKVIHLSSLTLVFWRMLITSMSLFLLLGGIRKIREVPGKTLLQLMGIGVIVAVHWVAFYGAIKLANASVALVTLATMAFFAALLEPLFMRQSIKWYEIVLGVLIIPGMMLIVNTLDLTMMAGVWSGLLAAFLGAIFGILNKQMVKRVPPLVISLMELGSGCLFLGICLPFYFETDIHAVFLPSMADWGYLVVLSLFCTTLPFLLSVQVLKHLSAFTTILTINLEPLYGIILAWLLLGEDKELTLGFYGGFFIILSAVFIYPFLRDWRLRD